MSRKDIGETSRVLSDRLRAVMDLDPSAPAIQFKGVWRSWGWAKAVGGQVEALIGSGAAGGVPVGLLARNRPGHLATTYSLMMHGHCAVMINPMQPSQAIASDIARLRLQVIVGDESDWATPGLVEAARAAGTLGIQLTANGAELVPGLEAAGPGPFRDDLAGIGIEMLTSGTTGAPKRVKLSLSTLAQSMADGVRSESNSGAFRLKGSPYLLFVPLVHASGMFAALFSIYEGRPIVLMEKFAVDDWRAAMVEHRPKFAGLAPPMIRMVLDADVPREDLSSLIAVRAGAAPLDPIVQEEFENKYGVPVLINYGATEFLGAVAGWTLEDHRIHGKAKRGSVGRARGDVELRVVDDQSGAQLRCGERGILEIRARRLGEDSPFVRTTDLASLDADNFLYIHGRSDDMIIRGGFKVSTETVTAALLRHPAVQEAIVLGMKDPRLGEVPVAAVELKAGAHVAEKALSGFLRETLVAYQVPARILIVNELPRTPSMKVNRPGARAQIEQTLAATQI